MSKSRKSRNRSAREKQLARQRAGRAARAALQETCPLYELQPPYRGYQKWFTPVSDAVVPADMPEDAAAVYAMVVALAPLYQGKVPLAAVLLEQQIRGGVLHLAHDGGGVSAVPMPDMATVLADTAEYFLGEPLPAADGAEPRELLHQLHALGALVLDDDQVIRLVALV